MDNIAFRDLLFLYLFGFLMLVVLMLPFLNPPAKEDEVIPPGNVIVHITWPQGDTDVDLWVTGPGESTPVGYSHKSGALWNLLRDDLGARIDATDINYENEYTRGVIPGEYVINVHCFRCPRLPVPVDVEVSLKQGDVAGKAPLKIIATTRVDLRKNKQELTAMRFVLDNGGKLKPKSLNHVFKPLRTANTP